MRRVMCVGGKGLKEAAAAVCRRRGKMAAEWTDRVGWHAAECLADQIMMLNDPFMMGPMEEQIAACNVAEAAVDSVCQTFIAMFSGMEDELMRQRATDIGDLRARLLKQLLGLPDVDLAHAPAGTVIVAQDFTPSMTVGISRENVVGIITEIGGRTSHSAILARALEIPAVLGVPGAADTIQNGVQLAIDRQLGLLSATPVKRTLKDVAAPFA